MMRDKTLRSKIIINSSLILLLTASATLYTGYASSQLAHNVRMLFRNSQYMDDLLSSLSNTENALLEYLTTKNSDSLKEYILSSTKLAEKARLLNREIREDESLLLQRNLSGILESFLRETEESVSAKRGRDVESYTERYENSVRSGELARFLAGRIDSLYLSSSLEAFTGFDSAISSVLTTNAILVIAATLMGFMLFVRYSYKLMEPLSRLAEVARAVGRGEYDGELQVMNGDDEITTTALAFESMRKSVKRSITELKEKADVERTLLEEHMRILDMKHRLKDTELLALQTQINPHFLFNTLSAGMQLALSEGSDRTAEFLEKLADFIRYTLRTPSRFVLVEDEIECLERYIWLLKLRFRERFTFDISVDKDALSVETPALVLQPLVENAVMHGLRDREEGGRVCVRIGFEGKMLVLEVSDSGEGMDGELAKVILSEGTSDEMVIEGNMEGNIGLRNVIRRVSLASGGRGHVELESAPGKGTTVRIFLPEEGIS